MSLRAYESAKERIETWVREWHEEGASEEGLIGRVERLDHPKGKQLVIDSGSLWEVTSFAAGMRLMCDNMIEAIHALEREIGREWYGRPRAPAHPRACGASYQVDPFVSVLTERS